MNKSQLAFVLFAGLIVAANAKDGVISPDATVNGETTNVRDGQIVPDTSLGSGQYGSTESGTASISPGNCPQDSTLIADHIKTQEVRSGVNQTMLDLIQKAGGASQAVAMLSAQKTKFEDTLSQAAQAARGSYGELGDPLAFGNCSSPQGIYCSSNYMYWMAKDAIILTDYQIKAIGCYRAQGVQ